MFQIGNDSRNLRGIREYRTNKMYVLADMLLPYSMKTSVFVCDSQPIAASGVQALLATCDDLEFGGSATSLHRLADVVSGWEPGLLLLDKSFGQEALLNCLASLQVGHRGISTVVWGNSATDAEALRYLQTGARGFVRKSGPLDALLACLRSVASGQSWVADFGPEAGSKDGSGLPRYHRSELTPRERQVVELVEQGFKNREIASELSICQGTVKIHLKHIFEKTGVRGRYGLALNGLKGRGNVMTAG